MDSNQLVGVLCSIEGCFEFGGWDVVAVAVEAGGVVPVYPAEGGELDVVNGAPWALRWPADELGLVVAVDRLREGIIERNTDGADRRNGTELASRSP